MSERDELLSAVQRGMSDIDNWPDDVGYKLLGVNMSKPQNAAVDAILAAGYRKVEAVAEWGAAFVGNGAVYNTYRTMESAKDFVDAMNEVDADMMVVTREHIPGAYGPWVRVA